MGKGFGKKFTESKMSPIKNKQKNPFTWKHKYGRYKFSLSSLLEIWSITWTGWNRKEKRYFVHICIMSCSGHQQPQLILQMFIKQEKRKKMRCRVLSHKHLTLYPRRQWYLPPVRGDQVTRAVHPWLIPKKTSLLSTHTLECFQRSAGDASGVSQILFPDAKLLMPHREDGFFFFFLFKQF